MKLKNVPHSNNLKKPKDIQNKNTSDLLEDTVFFYYKNPGLPHISPIAEKILSNMREVFEDELSKFGASKINIPKYMKRNLMDKGEKINKTFEEKFIDLKQPMENYMILTTPEMEVLDYIGQSEHSYKNLPLKVFFNLDILRPIKKPKGILKSRQFEVFNMLSIDEDNSSFKERINEYETISENIFNQLGISYKKVNDMDFDVEYYYEGNEGDNVDLGEDKKVKALSLSMGYKFEPKNSLVRIISKNNNKIDPIISTFGIGLERTLYSCADMSRDRFGFSFPERIRPFDGSILLLNKTEDEIKYGNELYDKLKNAGYEICLDDRLSVNKKEKYELSEYIGTKNKILLYNNSYVVKDRNNEELREYGDISSLIDNF